jgi:hypothetical protein
VWFGSKHNFHQAVLCGELCQQWQQSERLLQHIEHTVIASLKAIDGRWK